MKVRISEGHIRYRLTAAEVERLAAGGTLTVEANETLRFTLCARDVPDPAATVSEGQWELAVPAAALRSPSPVHPEVFTSTSYLIELDLKPDRP